MTTYAKKEFKCSVCGCVSTHFLCTSFSLFGPGKLDFEGFDHRLDWYSGGLMECPECGYVSYSIDNECRANREFIESELYRTCDLINFSSDSASSYYKMYMVAMVNGDIDEAFNCLRNAAKHCYFDEERYEVICREKALKLADMFPEKIHLSHDKLALIRIEPLRRTGRFDEAMRECSKLKFTDEEDPYSISTEEKEFLLKCQMKKAGNRDDREFFIGDMHHIDECIEKARKRKRSKDYYFYGDEIKDDVFEGGTWGGITTLFELFAVLEQAWCRETAHPFFRDEWTPDKPSCGQSDVTALLVHKHFGGTIHRIENERGRQHYFNKINGRIVDLASEHINIDSPEYYDNSVEVDENLVLFKKDEHTDDRYNMIFDKMHPSEI